MLSDIGAVLLDDIEANDDEIDHIILRIRDNSMIENRVERNVFLAWLLIKDDAAAERAMRRQIVETESHRAYNHCLNLIAMARVIAEMDYDAIRSFFVYEYQHCRDPIKSELLMLCAMRNRMLGGTIDDLLTKDIKK